MSVFLWIREDGEQPKAIQKGTAPPGPGKVVEVEARSSDEARRVYALSLQVVDEDRDPEGWMAARHARKRITTVGPGAPLSRCPFCRAEVAEGQAGVVACAVCKALHHGECMVEHGGCTVQGCSGKAPKPVNVDGGVKKGAE